METTSPRRRFRASVAIVSLLASFAVASAARAEDKAAILLPGSANDQSWNALGYSILKSLEPHGFKTAYSENVSDADAAFAHGFSDLGHFSRSFKRTFGISPRTLLQG